MKERLYLLKERLYVSKGICPYCKSMHTYIVGNTKKSYCTECKKTW